MLQFLSNYINFKKSFTNESKVKIQAKKRKRKKKQHFRLRNRYGQYFLVCLDRTLRFKITNSSTTRSMQLPILDYSQPATYLREVLSWHFLIHV